MKKITFTSIVLFFFIFFVSCNKEEVDIGINDSVELEMYGPDLYVQFHDQSGNDLLEKYKYIKYPKESLLYFVDGFCYQHYLDDNLVETIDKSDSENIIFSLYDGSNNEINCLHLRSEYVYRKTIEKPFEKYRVKIQFTNDNILGDSELHTIEYSFQRIEPSIPDKWQTSTPNFSDCLFDGQPIELEHHFPKTWKRGADMIDIIVK